MKYLAFALFGMLAGCSNDGTVLFPNSPSDSARYVTRYAYPPPPLVFAPIYEQPYQPSRINCSTLGVFTNCAIE